MTPRLSTQTHRILHRMVIWDAVRLPSSGAEYESACTLVRRGFAARMGARGRTGFVWFEPTRAGRDLILRPPHWSAIYRAMTPVRGMPAPRRTIPPPGRPVRPWFDDIEGREKL